MQEEIILASFQVEEVREKICSAYSKAKFCFLGKFVISSFLEFRSLGFMVF